MAMISPRDLYLRRHPELAKRVAAGKGVRRFLRNNPGIAVGWQRVMGATKPTLQDPDVPAPAPATPPAPAPDPRAERAASAEGQSAHAIITQTLNEFGLGGLAGWAWEQYVNGAPTSQIMLDLKQRPEYKSRFAGMAGLQAKGRAISEAEYIGLERGYAQALRSYGLPEQFYDDPSDFSRLIEGEVSAREFEQRLEARAKVVATSPLGALMREELATKYGVTDAAGLTLAYWIDPDRGQDIIMRQVMAAEAAAVSRDTGFGGLSTEQAEKVGALGLNEGQLRDTFGNLAGMDEFTRALPGQNDSVTRDDLLDASFTGDAEARKKVEKVARTRTAEFQGGGSFSGSNRGITGLGSANA